MVKNRENNRTELFGLVTANPQPRQMSKFELLTAFYYLFGPDDPERSSYGLDIFITFINMKFDVKFPLVWMLNDLAKNKSSYIQ